MFEQTVVVSVASHGNPVVLLLAQDVESSAQLGTSPAPVVISIFAFGFPVVELSTSPTSVSKFVQL
jgi:hypothetical protein